MQDKNAPKSLRDFQLAFGRHLRDPEHVALPDVIPARRAQVYETLLFNNLSSFVDACFPVAKSLFTSDQWQAINREFFRSWRCSTPIFSQIPFEFVQFIHARAEQLELAPWLSELLHYEWVELEVDLSEATVTDTEKKELCANPSLKLLAYQWPVHRISTDYADPQAEPCFLAVWRDKKLSVNFCELNATTHALLSLLQQREQSFDALMCVMAEQLGRDDVEQLAAFARPLLADLKQQHILTGCVE
ncbi:DNA-binding domain-containing protein [Agaribacterium haliotis]|uniref:HvfC family RiPP maturation protein n=1 Tax=Agaribacterium haliotis TaxID=2013869 RepID=UPI000BB53A19|nr:putative DNA-binding domain-containing protein [Agaribacterium haliotis]